MAERAIVHSTDNNFVDIRDLDDAFLTRIAAGEDHLKGDLVPLEVERVTTGSSSTAYPKVTQTAGVVDGKWRITTTVSDKAGQELAAAKIAQVSAADLTLAETCRWLINYLYANAKAATPALTKADFLAAITAAQAAPQGTPATQVPVTRAQMLTFLAGLL